MAISLPSPASVERLQRLIDFVGDLIPPRGWRLIDQPEKSTRLIIYPQCGFRWQKIDDHGDVLDFAGLTPAGASWRYGSEQLRTALVEASVDAFSKAVDEAFAGA